MTRTVPMIDVSIYQASDQRYPPIVPMNWAKTAAKGALGAYIRATHGSWDDAQLANNHRGAGANNLKRGAYHFFLNDDGAKQADYFLSVIGQYRWELPPTLDAEVECRAKQLWQFAKRVHDQTGVWCLIYTGPSAWAAVIDGFALDGILPSTYKTLISKHCELWQAQYPYAEYDDGIRVPALSDIQPWAKLGKTPVIHQYSVRNGKGRQYGSTGDDDIDLDLADDNWFAQFPYPDGSDDEPATTPGNDNPAGGDVNTVFTAIYNGQNVRSGPGTQYGAITTLSAGQTLYPALETHIADADSVWYRFALGWVAGVHNGKKFLETKKKE